MKRFIGTAIFLGLGLCVVGCNVLKGTRDTGPVDNTTEKALFAKREPTAADLVAFQNRNGSLVTAVQDMEVSMDAKQGNDLPIEIKAKLACQKPRQFRLKGTALGSDQVDIGSNDDEFWYWIGKADPHLFHCSYKDMATGNVRVPFPFNPDMIVCALNIADYNPNGHYELRKTAEVIELIEATKSMQGQDVYKVTIFNRGEVSATRPRVLGYALRDKKGKDICTATVKETKVNKETGAVLPMHVVFVFNGEKPAERGELAMHFYNLQPVKGGFNRDDVARLFTRTDLAHLPGYDLARGPDRPTGMGMSGVRQTGGVDR